MLMNMARWLKKYFIPHEHNDHRPHILRARATIAILALVLLIEVGFLTQTIFFSQTSLFATILRNVLIDETNSNRQGENLAFLAENPLLGVAATMKAEDMAEKGYFAHTSPAGIDPWYWIKKAGYDYRYAGENLAVNFVDSGDVMRAWLNSPAHRENITNRHFTEIGIGTATGTYEGKETVFVVQMFGTPVSQPILGTLSVVAVLPSVVAAEPATSTPGQEMFTQVLGADESVAEEATENEQVLGETAPVATPAQWVVTSPQEISNYLYAALIAIIALALLLNVIIKVRIQHPALILNGVIMLLIINTVLLLNRYLTLATTKIF